LLLVVACLSTTGCANLATHRGTKPAECDEPKSENPELDELQRDLSLYSD
jgi:hypothetical protein